MVLAVDISNYTGAIETQHVEAWRQAGVGLVLVQAVDPPAGYPAGCTAQQLATLLAASMPAEAYVYLWFDGDVGSVQHALSLLNSATVQRIWLDVEDVAAKNYDQATTEAKVQAALDACDAYAQARGLPPTGIYTGKWFWAEAQYIANTTRFKDRLLWDANYDNIADASVNFHPYGGWTSCAIKQYVGTSTLGGVQRLDRSALHPDYVAGLSNAPQPVTPVPEEIAFPVPARYTSNGWATWREVAINLQGIADELGQLLTTFQSELAGSDPDAARKLQAIRDILTSASPSAPSSPAAPAPPAAAARVTPPR